MDSAEAQRRAYHRKAVADAMRRLRREQGWTQEDLAERLGKDRRQVVRLESGTAPVTVETLGLLAEVFGVAAHEFFWSIPGSTGVDPAGGHGQSLAREELRRRFGARLDRPLMTWLVMLGAILDDSHLDLLVGMAHVLDRAAAADAAKVPDRSFLFDPIDYSLRVSDDQ